MTADTKKIWSRIRKLMAHQNSAEAIGSVEEASAFAERISELMAKYRLSIEEIPDDPDADPIDELMWWPEDHNFPATSRRQSWALDLAVVVARANGAEVLSPTGTNAVLFVGRRHEREVSAYLFTVLRRAIENECTRIGRTLKPRPYRWAYSFKLGAVSEIASRYRAMSTRVKADATSEQTDLIALRDSELDKEVQQRSAGTYSSSTPRRLGMSGYSAGRECGSKLNLSANAVGSSGSSAKPLL